MVLSKQLVKALDKRGVCLEYILAAIQSVVEYPPVWKIRWSIHRLNESPEHSLGKSVHRNRSDKSIIQASAIVK